MGKNGEGSWKEIVEGSYPPQRGEEKGRIDSAVIGFESRGEMWDTRSRDIPVASTWELLWNGCNERNVAPSTRARSAETLPPLRAHVSVYVYNLESLEGLI